MVSQTDQMINILSDVLKKIGDHVMITDVHGVIEYVNPVFEATTGYSQHEAIGQTPRILRSGRHDPTYYQKLWQTISSGNVFRAITINRKKNGDIYYADQTISPVNNTQGEISHYISIWNDVTEQVMVADQLKDLNHQLIIEKNKLEQVLGMEAGLHSILDLHQLIDFVVDKTCDVLDAQKCSIMFIDQKSGELCIKGHRGIEEHKIGTSSLKMGDHLEKLIKYHSVTEIPDDPNKFLRVDGAFYQSGTFLSVPVDLRGAQLGIINVADKKNDKGFTELDLKILFMIVRQVRIALENANLYRELKYLTITDPLTGVYNYRYFNQTLDYEIMRARRYQRNISFMMMDIDQLKFYNDTFGHLEGDKILKAVAQVIKQNIRETDVVCRYAGDEFSVILPETNLDQARITADKIRQKVSELSTKQPMSISIGLAEYASSMNRHDLIQRADSHLYVAKKQGRNQISG